MKVWLALDTYPEPEGGPAFLNRIAMRTEEFQPGDFPAKREKFFQIRTAEVDEDAFRALLAGELTPDEQDTFHRETWEHAQA